MRRIINRSCSVNSMIRMLFVDPKTFSAHTFISPQTHRDHRWRMLELSVVQPLPKIQQILVNTLDAAVHYF
jgi:hypothetical protein